MNNFIFENKIKVYFGKGGVKEHLVSLLRNYGGTVMLAYGGGSIKRSGVYDGVTAILKDAGKTVVEFGGIMPNPTYRKVQEGAKLARENHVDLILAVGGGSVSDCPGQCGGGPVGDGEHQARPAHEVHSPGHHRHGVRHRQRDEQRRGHHP